MPGGNDTDEIRDDSERLMRSLGITEDDLAFNERGEFSPGQLERLHVDYRNWTWGIIAIVVGACLLMILAIIDGIQRQDLILNRMSIILLILVLPVLYFLDAIGRQKALAADIAAGVVHTIKGQVRHPVIQPRGTYSVVINEERFRVRQVTFRAFRDGRLFGKVYVLYYLPQSRYVIGGKRLDATS